MYLSMNNSKIYYSETSMNCHLSTTTISLKQPVFNISKVQSYYIFDLSIVVTSLQQLLFCYAISGCCRQIALYFCLNLKILSVQINCQYTCVKLKLRKKISEVHKMSDIYIFFT